MRLPIRRNLVFPPTDERPKWTDVKIAGNFWMRTASGLAASCSLYPRIPRRGGGLCPTMDLQGLNDDDMFYLNSNFE